MLEGITPGDRLTGLSSAEGDLPSSMPPGSGGLLPPIQNMPHLPVRYNMGYDTVRPNPPHRRSPRYAHSRGASEPYDYAASGPRPPSI
eukprot:CAMPEP_0119145594 /NCGR_PEP_ID=MMETSP1310-20130426/37757_1 /TAXON_ID=464262 /ORGANISM="Genus nov. species nov., Strain RCC2339" /LENGTH=87 /DNA_ID=CAMNT_0007137423 /DNA_START=74 /DNA_END=337 /DNA_ORIENTATION=+